MRIEIAGRDFEVGEDTREHLHKSFARLSRQIPEEAIVEVVLFEEKNPSIRDRYVAEATLRLKGVTLHAEERSTNMIHAIKELSQDMRRQVKRHRELRRKRSATRRLVSRMRGREA